METLLDDTMAIVADKEVGWEEYAEHCLTHDPLPLSVPIGLVFTD